MLSRARKPWLRADTPITAISHSCHGLRRPARSRDFVPPDRVIGKADSEPVPDDRITRMGIARLASMRRGQCRSVRSLNRSHGRIAS